MVGISFYSIEYLKIDNTYIIPIPKYKNIYRRYDPMFGEIKTMLMEKWAIHRFVKQRSRVMTATISVAGTGMKISEFREPSQPYMQMVASEVATMNNMKFDHQSDWTVPIDFNVPEFGGHPQTNGWLMHDDNGGAYYVYIMYYRALPWNLFYEMKEGETRRVKLRVSVSHGEEVGHYDVPFDLTAKQMSDTDGRTFEAAFTEAVNR